MIVRAWAVVCHSGRFHRMEHDHPRLFLDKGDAADKQRWMADDGAIPMKCAPHRVVELRGQFKPKALR